MSGLICIFGKKVGSFRRNYLDLLFKHQDIGISTFTDLFNFSCNNFKLEQINSINFTVSFFLKLSFGEEQIPKRQLLTINNIVKKKYKGKMTSKTESISN